MTYELAGLVRLGGESAASAFLIPFFRNSGSNRFFAQELGPDHRISAFLDFNPFRYEVLQSGIPSIRREVGDLGVMAFVRRGQSPEVDYADKVILSLREANLAKDKSPFFELDAYQLTGQQEKWRKAIQRTKHVFGDGSIARAWARRELRVGDKTKHRDRNPDAFEHEVTALGDDFQSKAWVDRWIRLWDSADEKITLAELGLRFVEKSRSSTPQRGRVLSKIIGHRPARELLPFVDACISWMNDCAQVTPTAPEWPRIWRVLAMNQIIAPDMLVPSALNYLEQVLTSQRFSRQWQLVWRQLYRMAQAGDPRISHRLLRFAEIALNDLSAKGVAKPVVRALIDPEPDAETLKILNKWVRRSVHSSAWIDAYLAVLAERPGDQELIDLGRRWLDEDLGNLRRWSNVHTAVSEAAGGGPWFVDVARGWLLRANRQMSTWPVVATYFLQHSWDSEVADAAFEWLANNDNHSAAWNLSLALTNYSEGAIDELRQM